VVEGEQEAAMDEQEISLQELWMTVWKRAWLIACIVVLAMVTAYIASTYATPIYEAETSFLIRTQASGLSLPFDDVGNITGGTNTSRNYVEVLKSRTVMEKAVDRLGMRAGEDWPSVEELRAAVSAQVVAQTDAVRVKVQLADKHLARDLANALVDVLMAHNRDMNQAATRTAREYLARQLETSAVQLREAEERMLAVKAGSKITEPSAEAMAQINRLVELETQQAEAEVTMGQAQARVAKLREQLAGMSDTVVSSETLVEDSVVSGLRKQLADLEFQLASAQKRYTAQHPEVVKLEVEIAKVKADLNSAVARVVGVQTSTPNPQRAEALRQIAEAEVQIEAARAQRDGLARLVAQEQANLAKLPAKELDLARVTRDLELAQEINLMLRTKYEEMRVTEQMQISDIFRIDSAVTPKTPVKPRKMLNTAIAAVLGMFVGIGAAFIMEFADTSLKSSEEIEQALGLPILATIPLHVGVEVEQHRRHHKRNRSSTGSDSEGRKQRA
jgi:succinoglycan biosynthesis transport protein ExoP